MKRKMSTLFKATSAALTAGGVSLMPSFTYTAMSANEKILKSMEQAGIKFVRTTNSNVIHIDYENLLSLMDTNILPKSIIKKFDKQFTDEAFLEARQGKLYKYNFS